MSKSWKLHGQRKQLSKIARYFQEDGKCGSQDSQDLITDRAF
jgi:hypothetical protein